ncbi:uncharacterized protein M421DRAFT_30464, partial [Didymella exigua CBS 183.55]
MAVFFEIFRNKWITPPQETTEDYSGRVVIVTGATSGMGPEAVYKFAKLGASKVIIAARDLNRGASTKHELGKRLGRDDQLEVWELDMMSYDSVCAFAGRAHELEHLDVAILNAGTRRSSYHTSEQGWEEGLQVNTLSTVLLGVLLLPKLKHAKRYTGKTPVLEFVNSGLHQSALVPPEVRQQSNVLEHYNRRENFKEGNQYKFSKAFLMYATNRLASEVTSADVIITSICPGLVRSDLGRDHYFPGVYVLAAVPVFLFMKSPSQGADAILSATTQGEAVHGRFCKDDRIMPVPRAVAGSEMHELASTIWDEIVESLTQDVPAFAKHLDAALSPFGRKPPSAQAASLLRLIFPHTRARARARVRAAVSRLRPSSLVRRALEHEAQLRRRTPATSTEDGHGSGMSSYASGEAGGRRRRLAGYLKAANELRQTYTQQYAPGWSSREAHYDYEDDAPGSFPDAAIVRSGDEEMILFPSYARRHIKRTPDAASGAVQEAAGDGRDSTTAGDADFWKQQWDSHEDDNAVVDVDVRGWIYSPHRGQMSRKQRLFIGLARQLVGVSAPPAAAAGSASNSSANSRDPSPSHVGFRERAHMRQSQRDEDLAGREAEAILRKGEREAAAAAKGAYSERPSRSNGDDTQLYRAQSGESVRTAGSARTHQLAHSQSKDSLQSDDEHSTPLQRRASWNQPADMSPAELAEANSRLMARLRHFLAMPMANTPISVFFYNDNISKQRTIYTNAAGHFSMTAALDFVPTHVRILASEQLSATEEVIITDSKGISVISDIDDTIKHSAISSGAREIFRNVFIRDLSDLTIDGVREWYNGMSQMGVKFHYVSNSPWQLYPVISTYFSMAGLPPGSFHLKQYSGMMQGIFEPVAERKKVTLDKISRDFPERRFILIGDSGEADLEVYTDFVLENPGRVAAVFIRDVTTTETGGFFDPSVGSMSGSSSPRRGGGSNASDVASPASATRALSEEHDPELRAAIAASLRAFEEEDKKRLHPRLPEHDQDRFSNRPGMPARHAVQTAKAEPVANLIDLSSSDDEGPETIPSMRRANTDTEAFSGPTRTSTGSSLGKAAPPPPTKPAALRISSNDSLYASPSPSTSKAPPPPKPRRPSTTIRLVGQPSPLSQPSNAPTSPPSNRSAPPSNHPAPPSNHPAPPSNRPAPPSNRPAPPSNRPAPPQPNYSTKPQYDHSNQSYAGMARDKLYSVYNSLPAWSSDDQPASDNASIRSGSDGDSARKTAPPPPPPPRRNPAGAAASYVGGKASSAWQHAPSLPHRPQITSTQTSAPFSTTAQREKLNRSSTGSTLGLNGGGQGQTADGQYVNKREALWRQRWARAEQILSEQGVVLRSWRVGTDLAAEAEKIVKANERENRIGNKNGARASVNERSGGEGSLRRKPGTTAFGSHRQSYFRRTLTIATMPSSKGKPTDPKLREKVKEEVKQKPNKDGSGKGQMAAWKAAEISKEYEKQGGGYENEAGSKNEPKKGAPEAKSDSKKKTEEKKADKSESKDEEEEDDVEEEQDAPASAQKPKANQGKKADKKDDGEEKADSKKKAAPKKAAAPKKEKKEPQEGTRRSSRTAAKRNSPVKEVDTDADLDSDEAPKKKK